MSGLANAWQYFLMLGLWSVTSDGLVAQVLPFEWVSRPAAAPIRRYIDANDWCVEVYRLRDGIFPDVMTAASITIIDKRGPAGWHFHEIDGDGGIKHFASPTGTQAGVLAYTRVRNDEAPRAKRGLSPGTQQVLTLSDRDPPVVWRSSACEMTKVPVPQGDIRGVEAFDHQTGRAPSW